MSNVFSNKICDICGKYGKIIESWGKKYCKTCYEQKPKRGKGHSGLIKDRNFSLPNELALGKGIKLVRVPKGNKIFANLYLSHYPGSLGIVGRQINYLIYRDGKIVGIIGANSPPLKYKKFEDIFGKGKEKSYLNNNVFCLVDHSKNLGTQVLRKFRTIIQKDYFEKYGDKLLGLVTFVEPPRRGSVYKADNWIYLGETKGIRCLRRGDLGKWINKEWSNGTQKYIFVLKFKTRG